MGVVGLVYLDWWSQQSWSGRWSGPVLEMYHLEVIIWLLFEKILLAQDNCPHWNGGSSSRLQFLVIKMLLVLFF
jgi:hypothetical protein